MCHNGIWGTVCDNGWGRNEGIVTCRQLGYSFITINTYSNYQFGHGSGRIWLDLLSCIGTESQLFDCGHGVFGAFNCNKDAAVVCISK